MARYLTARLLYVQLCGWWFTLLGVLGMVVSSDRAADRLVVLHVNETTNLLHLFIGILGIAVGLTADPRLVRGTVAAIAGALCTLALIGLIGGHNPAGLFDSAGGTTVGIGASDIVMHAIVGVAGVALLLVPLRTPAAPPSPAAPQSDEPLTDG